jgi:hypothetical protein
VSERVQSRFQKVALGNILLGGIIGFGVDAMTGAMYEYPAGVMVALVPLAFPTITERNSFYDRMRASVTKDAEELKGRIRAECKEDCDAKMKVVEDAVAARMAEIETRRSAAKVQASGKT